jgi:hypothetical protein
MEIAQGNPAEGKGLRSSTNLRLTRPLRESSHVVALRACVDGTDRDAVLVVCNERARMQEPSIPPGTSLLPGQPEGRSKARHRFCSVVFELYAITASNMSQHLPRERWERICRELLCCTWGKAAKPVLPLDVVRRMYNDHCRKRRVAVSDAGSLERLLEAVAAAWWTTCSNERPTTLHPARSRWRGQMVQHAPIDAMLDTCASAFFLLRGRSGYACQQEGLLRSVGHFSAPWASFADGRLHHAMGKLLIALPAGAEAKLRRFESAPQLGTRDSIPCTPPRLPDCIDGGRGNVGGSDDVASGSTRHSDSAVYWLVKPPSRLSPSSTMHPLPY